MLSFVKLQHALRDMWREKYKHLNSLFSIVAATEDDTYEVKYACYVWTEHYVITSDEITNAGQLAMATLGINDTVVVRAWSSAKRMFFTHIFYKQPIQGCFQSHFRP